MARSEENGRAVSEGEFAEMPEQIGRHFERIRDLLVEAGVED